MRCCSRELRPPSKIAPAAAWASQGGFLGPPRLLALALFPQAYVTNLNAALEKYHKAEATGNVAEMIALQQAIRFNGQ